MLTDFQIQSDLILPIPLPLASLSAVTQEISGFFIVETHVLETTGTFRSEREVEELWEGVVSRLTIAVQSSLRAESDPDSFLRVKECLIGFIMTLEVHISLCLTLISLKVDFQSSLYSTTSLHSFIIVLFEKYAQLLEKQFAKRFDAVCVLCLSSHCTPSTCFIRLFDRMIVSPCIYSPNRKSRPFWMLYGSVIQRELTLQSMCGSYCSSFV